MFDTIYLDTLLFNGDAIMLSNISILLFSPFISNSSIVCIVYVLFLFYFDFILHFYADLFELLYYILLELLADLVFIPV